MNLDELQSVRDRERQTDKPQQLRETFYQDAGEFIQQLRAQRERAADRADDPFDAPEVNQLTDQIKTAEQTVEAIYEKRVGKLVKNASLAAADLPAESDGLTAEEKELFETMVDNIKSNRQHVLNVLDGTVEETDTDETPIPPEAETAPISSTDSGGVTPTEPTAGEPAPTESAESDVPPMEAGSDPEPGAQRSTESENGVSAADAMGGDSGRTEPPDKQKREPEVRNDGGAAATPEAGSGVDRETVRITTDVGDFLGFDEREYDLSENDVVTLPATNVEPLVSRDAAERIE